MAKIALAAVALTIALASPAQAATPEAEPPFCQQTTLRDFLAPLERLPKLEQPKPDGQLGFTKARVTLKPTAQLVVGGGAVGFKLQRPPNLPTIHPDWTVVANLSPFDWRGNPGRVAGYGKRKVAKLGRGRGGGLAFEVAAKPGPYQLQIKFRSRDGRLLAIYGFYFLVVKPFKDRRLALNATAYRPGETVFGRVENLGTMTTAYGFHYAIERLDGSQWSLAPESPSGAILAITFSPPGGTGPCLPFPIPASMPAGHYRMSKEVDGIADVSRATTLTAEFDVAP